MNLRALRNHVVDREDHCCCRCGQWAEGGSLHHRKLRSQGGLDTFTNLLLLCGSGSTGCHGHVHEHRTLAAVDGWIVPSYEDPATVPVLVYGHGRVFLDETGSYVTHFGDDPFGSDAA